MPAVLMSLNSHHYLVPVDVHPLLQIGGGGTSKQLETAREGPSPDKVCVTSRSFNDGGIAVDPECDSVAIDVARFLPDPLDPVHHFPREPLAPELLVQMRIERHHERSAALDRPVAGDVSFDS